MKCYMFALSQPFRYFKCGEFSADIPWMHKKMCNQGDYEVIFCIKGQLYLQIETEKYVLSANDVLLVPPYMSISGFQRSTTPVRFYWLHFFSGGKIDMVEAEKIVGHLQPLLKGEYVPKLNDKVILPCCFRCVHPEHVFLIARQVLDTANSCRYSGQESDYLMTAFLIDLSHQYLFQLITKKYPDRKIDKIKEWIRANMTNTLDVETISRQFEISSDYLTRLFKRYEHCTTRQYISNLKIQTAKFLLVNTNIPVNQICGYSYFTDEKNFLRRFKDRTNLTPSKYRNAYMHTHLNNPVIDPTLPLPAQLENKLFSSF